MAYGPWLGKAETLFSTAFQKACTCLHWPALGDQAANDPVAVAHVNACADPESSEQKLEGPGGSLPETVGLCSDIMATSRFPHGRNTSTLCTIMWGSPQPSSKAFVETTTCAAAAYEDMGRHGGMPELSPRWQLDSSSPPPLSHFWGEPLSIICEKLVRLQAEGKMKDPTVMLA